MVRALFLCTNSNLQSTSTTASAAEKTANSANTKADNANSNLATTNGKVTTLQTNMNNFKYVTQHSVYNGYTFSLSGTATGHVYIAELFGDNDVVKALIVFYFDGASFQKKDIFNNWASYGSGTISMQGAAITIFTAYGGYAKFYQL